MVEIKEVKLDNIIFPEDRFGMVMMQPFVMGRGQSKKIFRNNSRRLEPKSHKVMHREHFLNIFLKSKKHFYYHGMKPFESGMW